MLLGCGFEHEIAIGEAPTSVAWHNVLDRAR